MTSLVAVALLMCAASLDGERVLLVAAEPQSDLALRVRDELAADGFDVIVRDDDDVINVLDEAASVGAIAVVELHGSRFDLWNLGAGGADPEHAALSAIGLDRDVAAVRVAELLRARLLAPRRGRAFARRGPPRDDATRVDDGNPGAPRGDAFDVEGGAGARADIGLSGLPASLGVAANAGVVVDGLRLGVDLALPTLPAHITSPDGSADVSVTSGSISGGFRFDLAEHLSAELSVAGGAAWLHGTGHAAHAGQLDHDADAVVAVAGVDARVFYVFSGPLSAFLDVGAGALAPTPSIRVGNTLVAAGPARASVIAGVAFLIPAPSARP